MKKWLNDRQSRIRKEKEVAVERAAHFFRAVGRTSQPYLLACLSRRSRDTRRLAARMLYRMFSADGSSEDVIPLISVRSVVPLLADPDIAIVATAASILASQPEDAGPEAILAMLEHPDSSVAATGFRALLTAGRNGDLESWVTPDIRANVITATAVAAPHRASALRVLSYFSDAKSAEVLSAALDNAERSMDLNAAYALHMRGDARGRAWLLKSYGNDSDLTRRRHAWLGLVGRPDSEIVDILLDTFDEGGPNYAMDAATVSLERGNAAPADVARLRAAFAERLFGADEAKRRAVMICLGPRREKTCAKRSETIFSLRFQGSGNKTSRAPTHRCEGKPGAISSAAGRRISRSSSGTCSRLKRTRICQRLRSTTPSSNSPSARSAPATAVRTDTNELSASRLHPPPPPPPRHFH